MSGAGQQVLQEVVTARLRRALGELDYRRAVANAVGAGWGVSEISNQLGISVGALDGVLVLARQCAPVPPGFSGASPMEIAQRYSVGELDEDSAVAQLCAWPYERRGAQDSSARGPGTQTAQTAGLAGQVAGSVAGGVAGGVGGDAWAEVLLAVDGGLIPMSVYERVLVVVDPELAWAVQGA